VATFVVPLYLVVGLSRVEFPHYMLILLPFLAGLAVVGGLRLAARLGPVGGALVGVAVVISIVPTALNDVRLVRAAGAADTRTEASAAVATLPGAVWSERYGATGPRVVPVSDFGSHPDVLRCRCFAVVSSYMEERFRRQPAKYAADVRVYDAMRAHGRVVRIVAPPQHLAYNWDVLPRWGLDRLPVLGRIRATGPTITILDMR
jgi:hypothetical protein